MRRKEEVVNNRGLSVVGMGAMVALLSLGACRGARVALPAAPTPIGTRCDSELASCNMVAGYAGNGVADGISGAVVSGGGQRGAPNRVSGDYGTVAGGEANLAGEGSAVSGGSGNTAVNFHAAVGGGANNSATAQEATVAGGFKNTASGRFAAVGGGSANVAGDIHTTVAGGSGNTATFTFASVGGGTQNGASSTAAVVAGGDHNLAAGAYSAVLGGLNNNADGYLAAIGGGGGNSASGAYAAVPGGFANAAAGDDSFAAGRQAQVLSNHPGSFLFADSVGLPFQSLAPNEFAIRATGGVRLVTSVDGAGVQVAGVRLSAGSGSWETLSDASSKSGFASVDGRNILQQLMSVPIRSWYYKGQHPSVRHVGPTAQDFAAAFHLGEDNHYISTVDADGVALAAIQELYRMQSSASTPTSQARLDFSGASSRAVKLDGGDLVHHCPHCTVGSTGPGSGAGSPPHVGEPPAGGTTERSLRWRRLL